MPRGGKASSTSAPTCGQQAGGRQKKLSAHQPWCAPSRNANSSIRHADSLTSTPDHPHASCMPNNCRQVHKRPHRAGAAHQPHCLRPHQHAGPLCMQLAPSAARPCPLTVAGLAPSGSCTGAVAGGCTAGRSEPCPAASATSCAGCSRGTDSSCQRLPCTISWTAATTCPRKEAPPLSLLRAGNGTRPGQAAGGTAGRGGLVLASRRSPAGSPAHARPRPQGCPSLRHRVVILNGRCKGPQAGLRRTRPARHVGIDRRQQGAQLVGHALC